MCACTACVFAAFLVIIHHHATHQPAPQAGLVASTRERPRCHWVLVQQEQALRDRTRKRLAKQHCHYVTESARQGHRGSQEPWDESQHYKWHRCYSVCAVVQPEQHADERYNAYPQHMLHPKRCNRSRGWTVGPVCCTVGQRAVACGRGARCSSHTPVCCTAAQPWPGGDHRVHAGGEQSQGVVGDVVSLISNAFKEQTQPDQKRITDQGSTLQKNAQHTRHRPSWDMLHN